MQTQYNCNVRQSRASSLFLPFQPLPPIPTFQHKISPPGHNHLSSGGSLKVGKSGPPPPPRAPPVPCWAAPALSPPCSAIRKCQFLSPTTAPVVAQGKELQGLGLCDTVQGCNRGRGRGRVGGGARALYQARTGSRLLPTHRPWRLTTPPSPFFAPSRLSIAGGGDDDFGEAEQSAGSY